jgi:type IV pilus assembly protein PilV
MRRHAESRRHNASLRGFTLVEVLVALIVLSIGMLGIASLYSQALGAGRSTQYRSQAVNLLSDLADRIRVNRLGQAAYSGAPANNACDAQSGGPADCNPAQMAAHDLYLWDRQVTELLPSGQWNVAYSNAASPPMFTISVTWEEVGQGRVGAELEIQVPTI